LQVFQHPLWTIVAVGNPVKSVEVHGERGEILDRNGLPMAVTLPLTYALGFRPKPELDLNRLSDELSKYLPSARRTIRKRLDTDKFIYLARRVDVSTKHRLEALQLDCFQFDEEPRRTYPGGNHAAAVVGFTNVDGIGQEGVEASMDSLLAASSYHEVYFVDARQKTAALMSSDSSVTCAGADVTLTIDFQLQTIVEAELRDGLKDQVYERACALLIQPQTGEILALATLPNFDPNAPGDVPAEFRKCWPVTDVFEPGSVMKIVPIAKALESHKLRRNSVIFCGNGSYRVRGATIHDSHPYGNLTLDEILSHSSNIGAAKVSMHFRPSEIYDKLRAFGFGNMTTVELIGEQSSVVPAPAYWSGPTQSNLAMGHGISATTLQVAMAYGSVATGGYLMKPRLIKYVDLPSGARKEVAPEVIRRVMSTEVARNLTEMLETVIESGTGKAAQIEGVRIAGKTGTAQKVDHAHKTYFQKRFVSSFVGFLPADNPQYLLIVVVDDPRGNYFGAQVAAPVFKNVMEEIIAIHPLEPVQTNPAQPIELATSSEQQISPVSYASAALGAGLGSHTVTAYRSMSDSGYVTMPDIEGWPLRQAIQALSLRNLDFQLFGNGAVLAQYPVAGSPVRAGTVCRLYGTIQ
jgi:cell division protein FtsI (penicillin-binding protein 3)